MSFYATIEGELTYENDQDFQHALSQLTGPHGWINEHGEFVDECDELIEDEAFDAEIRLIRIPYGLHRNLNRVLDKVCKNSSGRLVCSSTDGVFDGWVIEDGNTTTTWDLSEWASEHGFRNSKPNEDDYDAYSAWINEVEEAWREWIDSDQHLSKGNRMSKIRNDYKQLCKDRIESGNLDFETILERMLDHLPEEVMLAELRELQDEDYQGEPEPTHRVLVLNSEGETHQTFLLPDSALSEQGMDEVHRTAEHYNQFVRNLVPVFCESLEEVQEQIREANPGWDDEEADLLECLICGEEFTSDAGLRDHLDQHHGVVHAMNEERVRDQFRSKE